MLEEVSYKILEGDAHKSLKVLGDKTIDCGITSPPYFGLRDYGVEGQIGLEQRAPVFISALVKVFGEVYRVLKDEGVLFVNIGDSFSSYKDGKLAPHSSSNGRQGGLPKTGVPHRNQELLELDGFRNKELMGIPWRFALAMREAGWLLRQEIIWSKPNYTPECVRDRFVKSHEHIFMFTKKDQYWFDGDAARIPDKTGGDKLRPDVWNVGVSRYKGEHCATFPPELIEPCVLAGCPKGGIVLDVFGGTGTTAAVSLVHGRNSIICELNPNTIHEIKPRVEDIVGDYMNWSGYPSEIKKNGTRIQGVRQTKRLW